MLFPSRLLEQVSAAQRDTLILHELAHVARRDHWVRLLELVASGLYWWLPVVWLARRGLHAAEEECCDARVLRALPDSGRDYALALVQTLTFLSPARRPLPATASGVGPVSQIKRRLTMILCHTPSHTLSRLGGAFVLALALLVLPCAPSLAQPQKEPPPSPREVRQRQIEVLRQLLKTLEEQQLAEQKAAKEPVQWQQAIQWQWQDRRAEQQKAEQAAAAAQLAKVQWTKEAVEREQRQKDAAAELARQKAAQEIQAWKNKLTLQGRDQREGQDAEVERLRVMVEQTKAELRAAEARLRELQAALERLSKKSPPATSTPAKKPPGEGQFEAIRLSHATAADVAKVLDEHFNGTQKERPETARRIYIVADAVSNSLLIQGSPGDLQSIREMLSKLLDTRK